jgi:hypothetical protein
VHSGATAEGQRSSPGRAACLNCGTALQGRYCHRCGQEDRDPDPTLRELLAALLDAILNWDSRIFSTLRSLVLRPGRMTAEFNAGRRARYVSPVRLYVVVSVIFLAAATLAGEAVIGGVSLNAQTGVPDADARLAWGWVVRGFGWSMFFLVPAFAGVLKLLYLRSGRRYVHHLVFAVHYHAFAFLVLTPAVVLLYTSPALWLVYPAGAAMLWIMVWPIIAMREAYGEGWLLTFVKTTTLLWLYFSIIVPMGAIPMAVILAVVLGGGGGAAG